MEYLFKLFKLWRIEILKIKNWRFGTHPILSTQSIRLAKFCMPNKFENIIVVTLTLLINTKHYKSKRLIKSIIIFLINLMNKLHTLLILLSSLLLY